MRLKDVTGRFGNSKFYKGCQAYIDEVIIKNAEISKKMG